MRTSLALLFALFQDADHMSDARRHMESGNALYAAGQLVEAQAEYRVAIRILDRTPSAELAAALNNLGSALIGRHEYERALPVFRRASQLAEELLPLEQATQIQYNTAQAMIRVGLYRDARPLLENAMHYAEAHEISRIPELLLSRATVCIQESDYACAHHDINRAMQSIDPRSKLAAVAHGLRASAWQRLNHHTLAVEEFAISVEIGKKIPGWERSAEAADLLESFSVSLSKAGQRKRAKALVREINRTKRMDPTP